MYFCGLSVKISNPKWLEKNRLNNSIVPHEMETFHMQVRSLWKSTKSLGVCSMTVTV